MAAFLNRLRAILSEINRPSAQRDSWFGWASVQTAHTAIGVALAGVLLFFLPPIWAFAVASLGYALVKELPDYFRAPSWAGARDSVQDALFVTAGAAQAVAINDEDIVLFAVSVIAAAIAALQAKVAQMKAEVLKYEGVQL